jgi:hypothetical protein
MEYEGSENAISFGRWFVWLIMDGALQHVLTIAAAVLAQTGHRSFAVPFSCCAGQSALDDKTLPSK